MEFDYIVVGAGSAGSPAARRLSDAGFSVLLLEAGGSDRHPFVAVPAASILAIASKKFNWMYQVRPDSSRLGREDIWPAGKCLGGSSAINGMMYIRGHPHDYDGWAQQGCEGWDYDTLLPYFKKLEKSNRGAGQYRGDVGPQSVDDTRAPSPLTDIWIKAVEAMGVPRADDLNGAAPDGVDYVQATQKRGWRATAGSAFVRPVLGSSALQLELGAEVSRIFFRSKRASGVEYMKGGKQYVATARNGVVVSAGAMASPALLLRSGIGEHKQLEACGIPLIADLPGVGQNLQDHPGIMLSYNISERTFGSDVKSLRSILHGLNFAFRGRGPLTTSIGHAQAFIRSSDNLTLPNIQLITSPFAYDFNEVGASLVLGRAMGTAIGLMRPTSRGKIFLDPDKPHGRPIIEHKMLKDQGDVDHLIDGVKFVREMMRQSPMDEIVIDERFPGACVDSPQALDNFVRKTCFSMYHQVGTCKMGSDDLAVVDPSLRVRGVDGLWVADASIMPSLPSGNTNATAMMIGERAADLIQAADRSAKPHSI